MESGAARAWLQIGSGVALIGLMGGVAWNMIPMLLAPGREVDGSTFTGTAAQAQTVLMILGLTALFGLAALTSGIVQLMTGRQNRLLTSLAVGIASVLMGIACLVPRFGL